MKNGTKKESLDMKSFKMFNESFENKPIIGDIYLCLISLGYDFWDVGEKYRIVDINTKSFTVTFQNLNDSHISKHWNFDALVKNKMIKKVDDFEETNYEEWVEEGKMKYRIGTHYTGKEKLEYIEKMTIVDKREFKQSTDRYEREFRIGVTSDGDVYLIRGEYIEDVAYLKFMASMFDMESDKKILKWFNDTLEKLNNDKPEDSNYEEWVEELYYDKYTGEFSGDFNVGDKVRIKVGDHHGKIAIVKYIRDVFDMINHEYTYDYSVEFKDGTRIWYNAEHLNKVKELDDYEESDREEWIQESNGDVVKFNIHDRVKYRLKKGESYSSGTIIDIRHHFGEHKKKNPYWYIYLIQFDNGEKMWIPYSSGIILDKDNPETSNFEEWVQEFYETNEDDDDDYYDEYNDSGLSEGDMVQLIPGSCKLVEDYPEVLKFVGEIIEIDGFDVRMEWNNNLKLGGGWSGHRLNDIIYSTDNLKLYKEDIPEESDREEWIEESNKIKYKIGDKVKLKKDSQYYDNWNGHQLPNDKIGEIYDIENEEYGDHPYKVKWNISPTGYKKNSYNYRDIEYAEDEPEETNYETWLEESTYYKYKIGDRVKHINCDCSDNNKIGTVTEVFPNGDIKVDFGDKSSISFGNDELKKYVKFIHDDEPEETNYEQWLEESKKYRFKIGDVVEYTNIHSSIKDAINQKAKVIWIDYDDVAVEFFHPIDNCFSQAEQYGAKLCHGLLCSADKFKLVYSIDDEEESNMEEWNENKKSKLIYTKK